MQIIPSFHNIILIKRHHDLTVSESPCLFNYSGINITAENFMDMLETGVVLCQLAEELQERMILASNGKVLIPKHLTLKHSHTKTSHHLTLTCSSVNYRVTTHLSLAGLRLMLMMSVKLWGFWHLWRRFFLCMWVTIATKL